MSSINNVGSSAQVHQFQPSSVQHTGQKPAPAEVREQRLAQREARLGESLEAAGVENETANEIKSQLRTILEEGFAEGHDRESAEAVREQVDGLFAEYGLEASEFVGPPPGNGAGGREGGRPSGGGKPGATVGDSSESTAYAYETVLELLESASNEGAEPEELAQLILDALYGLDEYV